MIDWQPIETAPRDGTLILLGCETDPPPPGGTRTGSIYPDVDKYLFFVSLGWFRSSGVFVNASADNVFYHASHWAPITSPIPGAMPAFYSLSFLKRHMENPE